MSGLGVVLDVEGEEGGAGWGTKFKYWFVTVRVEASSFSRSKGRIFGPDFEFPVSAYRGHEVGMDGGREPFDLRL